MSAQDILVLAETSGDGLADITLEMLAAARQLVGSTGGQVVVLVLGNRGEQHAAALSAADRIVVIDDPLLAGYAPEPYLAVLESVVRAETPRAVLIGSTSIGWTIWPRCWAPSSTGRCSAAARRCGSKATCCG